MAWLDSGFALMWFVIGVLGGGWLFYIAAAFWAFNAFKSQQIAWQKEDHVRECRDGADGEGSGQDPDS